MSPTVSFVVPCYNLAHYLGECVQSILDQTFTDFEVLIMDDCSPDDTPAVAHSFRDPRVRYVRNDPNLGHLRNYNKGIGMAQGKYVWLISADDRLRKPYTLMRYVEVMEKQPSVGYLFCPAVGVLNGAETRVIHSHGSHDAIFKGREFLMRLLNANSVVAASGMARKECYERGGYFPLDMPWGGDWYLWCLFALHYDVAYLAEPLVNYRTHELSMTNLLTNHDPKACANDDLLLYWRLMRKAAEANCASVADRCRHMIAYEYARSMVSARYENTARAEQECEESIIQLSSNPAEARAIRARFYACTGDRLFWVNNLNRAVCYYALALKLDPWSPKTWAKRLLLRFGRVGLKSREMIRALCRAESAKPRLEHSSSAARES